MYFFSTEIPDAPHIELRWFFYWTFCAAASTIVSGGVAGRVKFQTYLGYTVLMSIWVFALPVHCVYVVFMF